MGDIIARRKTHLTFGVLISLIILSYLISKGLVSSFWVLTIALASSAVGAVLPDVVERPKSSRHRKFFHSVLFLALVLLFLAYTYTRILTAGLGDEVTFGLFFAGVGYVTHLLLDALTPARLPVVGL
ncbi:hypothetical protein FTO70_10655 [Methanosarcina sp. KYL-1]|uniref:metal-dependent hydrolase n=1 Tax=Methanosarcina sp. KYL-1 TaxID=2602068 RepID=UPI0021009D67|nr:metal-dependent hydrolase [Methanosarcina sp. KYL-1]MCQ1536131.1 hypothetical protein [Methanosarcina sp. KYL-1]